MKLLTQIIAPGIVLAAALLTTTNAFADATEDWYYDCNDPVESTVAKPVPPNIYIMQDVSGSMKHHGRWEAAQSGILALLDDNRANHIADYGLGVYSSDYHGDGVDHEVDCGPNSTNLIYRKVSRWNRKFMYGGTNTAGAVTSSMKNRCNTQRGPGQSSATMLITDGTPDSKYDALEAACEHRKVAKLYVVGLGTGTDIDFNNLMAAGGGSGSCPTMGDPCADIDDVINQRYYQWKNDCSGSYTVTNTAALTNALRTIVAEVSCTFPVEATNGTTVVPEDPNNRYPWVRVETVDASGTATRVPYALGPDYNSSDPGWSWTFAAADRKTVSLGAEACKSLKENVTNHNKAESVTTQLGCVCEQTPNTACGDDSFWTIPNVCPEGKWTCNRGKDLCEMPKVSSQTNTSCTVPNTFSHCAQGKYECRSNGDVVCVVKTGPMPELCNGYDDDCDGRIDNISQSWRKPDRASYIYSQNRRSDLYRNTYSRACLFLDICVCKEANPNMTMADGSNFSKDYPQYLDDWTNNHGTCNCSPN